MPFSVPSPGRLLLLLLLSRVAGALRTLRLSPEDLNHLSKPENSSSGIPSITPLSTSSPGYFLGLDIPSGTFLLRFYGHKHTTASLYGVCVDCNEDYQRHWVVDGHDTASSNSSDSAPSCLFSIALEGHLDDPIQLHNLYDPRFEAYGEINFSFVEYVLDHDGGRQQPVQTTGICGNHLRWSNPNNILSRRSDDPSCPPSSSTDSGSLNGKIGLIIGLIVTLIATVIISLIVVVYVLRRRKRLPPHHDSDGRNNLILASGKSASQTLFSNGEITVQAGKEEGKLPSQGYISGGGYDTRITDPTSSSFSTHTQADPTKAILNRDINVETVTNASTSSRQTRHWTRPPTSPPKEPVPALPSTTPTETPIHYLHTKTHGDSVLASSSPSSSPVQSRRQLGRHPSQPGPTEGLQTSQTILHHEDAPGPTLQGPPHNYSSSSNPQTYQGSHLPRRVRPRSKQLPTIPIESPVHPKSPANRGQFPNRHSRSDRKSQSMRPFGTSAPMEPIGEVSTNTSDEAPSQSSRTATRLGLERTRSAEDVRSQAQPKTPVLRGSKSSPEFEHPETSKDIRLAVATQSSRTRDHTSLLIQNTTPAADISRMKRWSVRSQLDRYSQPPRLSIKIPPGSDLGELVAPRRDSAQLPSGIDENMVEIAQVTRMQMGRPQMRDTQFTSASDVRQLPARGAQRPPLPQPPSYEQVVTVHHPIAPLAINPLSPRKRALPKPPS